MSCHADGTDASALISTLDLVSITEWRMLLLLRAGSQCHAWIQAASTLVRVPGQSWQCPCLCCCFVALSSCPAALVTWAALFCHAFVMFRHAFVCSFAMPLCAILLCLCVMFCSIVECLQKSNKLFTPVIATPCYNQHFEKPRDVWLTYPHITVVTILFYMLTVLMLNTQVVYDGIVLFCSLCADLLMLPASM